MGRNILNLGFRLFLFMLVAAVLLAGTNLITRGPIAEHKLEEAQSAQRAVLAEAETFVEKTPADYTADTSAYPLLNAVYEGQAGGQTVGYVLTAAPQGYGGPIPITLGVGLDGSIHGVAVGGLQETSGLGSRVAEAPFLNQYNALAADPAVIGTDVDTLSGATVSSRPFKEATMQMTAFTKNVLGVEPHPGVPQLTGEVTLEPANIFGGLGYDAITAIYQGVDGITPVNYTFDLAPKGFVDAIHNQLALDMDGNIISLTIGELHETEGYGARLATQEGTDFAAQFTGKAAATPEGIDVLSGATISSNAVIGGVKQAGEFYANFLAPKPDPDAGLTFTDITLPTPDDYKAVQSAQQGERDGAVALYRFVVKVTGYHEESPILLQVDINADGTFRGLTAIEQHETDGIGAGVFTNADFLGQFITKTATVESIDSDVQAVSGATVTSDAIKRGLKQATKAYLSLAGGAAAPAGEAPAAAVPTFPTVDGAFAGATFENVAFTDTDKKFPTVKLIEKATKDGAPLGYRLVAVATGYNEVDKITVQVEIGTDGNIADVKVLSHAETAGIGAVILDDMAWVTNVVALPAVAESAEQVSAKSGATVTSDAFRKAIKQAALAYQAVKEAP